MKALLLSLALLGTVTAAKAQTTTAEEINALQQQYDRIKATSNSYHEFNRPYKVVEVRKLDNFWQNVQQTIQANEKNLLSAGKATVTELEQAKGTMAAQTQEIEALKQQNAVKEKALQQNDFEVSNIVMLGLGINKQVFVILSFSIILGLLALAGIVYSMYKNSQKVTDEKILAFQTIDQEFNDYKKAARERELKIKRDLQTEANAKEELRQELASLKQKAMA